MAGEGTLIIPYPHLSRSITEEQLVHQKFSSASNGDRGTMGGHLCLQLFLTSNSSSLWFLFSAYEVLP